MNAKLVEKGLPTAVNLVKVSRLFKLMMKHVMSERTKELVDWYNKLEVTYNMTRIVVYRHEINLAVRLRAIIALQDQGATANWEVFKAFMLRRWYEHESHIDRFCRKLAKTEHETLSVVAETYRILRESRANLRKDIHGMEAIASYYKDSVSNPLLVLPGHLLKPT